MKNFVVTQLHTEMCHPRPARMQRHRGKVQMVSLVGIDRRNPGKCHGGSGFLALARSYNNLKFNLFKIYWPWKIAGVKLREKNGAQVDRACGPDPKIMQPTLRPVFQWGIIFKGDSASVLAGRPDQIAGRKNGRGDTMKNFVVTQLHAEMRTPHPARMLLHRGEVVSLVDKVRYRRNPGNRHS